MGIDIKVPVLGESVVEATISRWIKKVGDQVNVDQPIVELETDKVTLEVPSPIDGTLVDIIEKEGSTVGVDALLAVVEEGAISQKNEVLKEEDRIITKSFENKKETLSEKKILSPAVKKLVEENNLDTSRINGTGKDGRITKGDVKDFISKGPNKKMDTEVTPSTSVQNVSESSLTHRVPMSRLRRVIAERLKEAQNTAAMLSTFNEVDMTAVINLRKKYKESFEKNHNVKLGFMGFFVMSVISALKSFPAVNGEIDGNDIVYKNFYNIGVAVGTSQGLVVPVLKDAQKLSLSEIENKINEYGNAAREGNLSPNDMSGGTFTISNGGVYGSLMSTPILNPPQSGILGMHKIQNRPVAIDDNIEIRPMMYLALSYDHRIIDGREAVSFLVKIKENIEDPQRLILNI